MISLQTPPARAILDEYKHLSNNAIKRALEPKRHNFTVLVDNRAKNLNVGTTLRSSHAFLGQNFILYGRASYNRKPAIGLYCYEDIEVIPDLLHLEQYIIDNNVRRVVAVDNNINYETQYLHEYEWPSEHVLVMFGSEGEGLPEELLRLADDCVEIMTFGVNRSVNLSCAASIVLYDYCVKTNAFSAE